MFQLLIHLLLIINLYKWNNMPYSKYVITDESFLELVHNIDIIMSSYNKIQNESIKFERNTNILNEKEFVNELILIITNLEKKKIEQNLFNNEIINITKILDNWVNIFYAH